MGISIEIERAENILKVLGEGERVIYIYSTDA